MLFSDDAPKKGFVLAIASKSDIKKSDRKKVLSLLLFSLNASVTSLLPANSSHSVADLYLMYLGGKLCFKTFFYLVYNGLFLLVHAACQSLCIWTEAENKSIARMNASQVDLTKSLGCLQWISRSSTL